MASKLLKRNAGPLGILALIANYGYHHKNYLKSFFQTQKPLEVEPIEDFHLPVDFEEKIDKFCEGIENNLSKYPKNVTDNGIEVQGDFKYKKGDKGPDGSGVISVPKQGFRMTGNFVNGKIAGMGIVVDESNRLFYKGIMQDGSLNGLGIWTIADEYSYRGNFVKSKPHGHGKFIFKDGRECVIRGPEKPDQRDFAVCHDEEKILKYKGDWEDGNFNGKGTFFFSDGSSYEGDFQSGQMHGEGSLIDKYGDLQYKGKFKDGERQSIINYYSEPLIVAGIVVAYVLTRVAL